MIIGAYVMVPEIKKIYKRLILVCIFVIFAGLLLVYYDRAQFEKNNIISYPELKTDIVVSSNFKMSKPIVTYKENTTTRDTVYTFYLRSSIFTLRHKVSSFTLTVRKVNNGDIFVFSHLNGSNFWKKSKINVSMQFPESKDDFSFHDFNPKKIERVKDPTRGLDLVTNPVGIYESPEHSLLVSKTFNYRMLTKHYDDGGLSVVRELNTQTDTHRVHEKAKGTSVSVDLAAAGENIDEHWMMLSTKPFFEDPNNQKDYITETTLNYKDANRWLSSEGKLYKLQWSIEPFTRMGYGLNLGGLPDKDSLDKYKVTKERFYYNLVMDSITSLEQFKDNHDGAWLTDYTSTWVKDSYDIHAPYLDTRHNQNIGLFLMLASEAFTLPQLKLEQIPYAEFLSHVPKEERINTPNGYFIPDYSSSHTHKQTHVSLNHALGEMNFLFDMYDITQTKDYLDAALFIRAAVEDTGLDWINKDNGDLYYEMKPDFTYHLIDYPTLTLDDLLISQENFKKFSIESSPIFDALIRSKVTYVTGANIGIPIWVKTRLLDQGYGSYIENYNHFTLF